MEADQRFLYHVRAAVVEASRLDFPVHECLKGGFVAVGQINTRGSCNCLPPPMEESNLLMTGHAGSSAERRQGAPLIKMQEESEAETRGTGDDDTQDQEGDRGVEENLRA